MSSTDVLQPILDDPPDISDQQIEAIDASLPRCPTCSQPVYEVHFIAHQTHRMDFQIDGSCGDILAASSLYDTVQIEPNGQWIGLIVADGPGTAHSVDRFEVEVTCEQGHQWLEPRLKLTRLEGSAYATWEVLPAEVRP